MQTYNTRFIYIFLSFKKIIHILKRNQEYIILESLTKYVTSNFFFHLKLVCLAEDGKNVD